MSNSPQKVVAMRAKPSSRRYRRPFRALHVEPLEKRALLSGGGFVDAASVAGADPPPVITFVAANTISDVWDFEGTVTDNGKPVAGLKVEFGGVLSKYGLTGTVEADGTYSVTDELRNIARGTATAQTHAQNGKASNVAMDYILNNPASSSVPPSSDPTTDELDTISTIAGLYRYRGDGQTVAEASLNSPQGLAVDSSGNLFIADTCNNAIREVNLVTRAITTIAGSGVCGYQRRPWSGHERGTERSHERRGGRCRGHLHRRHGKQRNPRGQFLHRRDQHRRRKRDLWLQRRRRRGRCRAGRSQGRCRGRRGKPLHRRQRQQRRPRGRISPRA